MLTNKQIHTLLLENKGDLKAFQKFVGFKSRQAMEFRLASTEPKNNLDGQYKAFILEKKTYKYPMRGFGDFFSTNEERKEFWQEYYKK